MRQKKTKANRGVVDHWINKWIKDYSTIFTEPKANFCFQYNRLDAFELCCKYLFSDADAILFQFFRLLVAR